ncbi:MAG: adenylyltransferase/cytidyltransferase family protein [bacterium]
MSKVMIFGTFDIFHEGHKNFLAQAKSHGNYLIAVISRDKTVKEIKKHIPLNNEISRMDIVKKSGLADEVILGGISDKYSVIKKWHPNIICLGYDQNHYISEKLKNFLHADKELAHIKIVRLAPHKPEIYKSSFLR